MIKDFVSLAFENLKHRGIRTWLTMLGIFIGVASVVALISLGQGLQNAVTAQFSSLSVDTLIVQNAQTSFGPPGSTSVKKLTSHDLDIISSVPGVAEMIPRILRVVKTSYNKKTDFEYAASLPDNEKQLNSIYTIADLHVDQGKLLTTNDRFKVVLGSDFLKTSTTDKFGRAFKVGSKITLQDREFTVAGILKPAGEFTVNMAMLINEKDLKTILNIGDETDFVVVRVQDKDHIEDVAKAIELKLRKDRGEKTDEEDFTIQTPIQALSTVNTILSVVNIIVIGIAVISLLVGGIGIMNTMYTSVLERKREIGVMKAVGARNSEVLSIFVLESGLLGLVGGIVGAAMGMFMALAVSGIAFSYFGSNILNVQVSWPLILASLAFSFLIGTFSGLLPSFQASSLKPVEALRA